MEQNQNSPQIPYLYTPPTSITYAYPPEYHDTMATNYVNSLTSTPYYYFIPRSTYASGCYYLHPHYAYGLPQYGIPMAISPNLEPPTNSVQYSYVSPNRVIDEHENYQQLQVTDSCQVENGELIEVSEKVQLEKEKSIDPRVINILEPFRQLYSEREESLKAMFPGIYSKLSEFFKRVNSLISEAIVTEGERSKPPKSLMRSLSLGSSTCKNERFKVRPIDSEETLIVSQEGKKGDDQHTI